MTEPSSLTSIRVAPRVASARPPLLLLLHGFGADEHDLVGLARSLDGRFVVRSVQAPIALPHGGRAWFPIHFAPDGTRTIGAEEAESSRRQLLRFIDEAVAAENADPERVYLAGFSQGGMMALGIGLTEPAKVAGVVAMSARVLPGFEARRAPNAQLAGLPVLVVHGTSDGMVPIANGRAARDLLSTLGVALEYREFPMSHEISPASLGLVSGWLTARLDGPRRIAPTP